jgi:coproporphyrinogen III oxidase
VKPQRAASERAGKAMTLVESLQQRFVSGLEKLGETSFSSAVWLRDAGRHGGGRRFGAADTAILGRASVNVSQVHYDDEPDRKLGSATAISTIVHPAHPLAPSVHIHVSWTEQKEGRGYWRIMADLNPAISANSDRLLFYEALRDAAPGLMDEAAEQGDRYFFIPTLNRHRGVIHFYLENYNSGDFAVDYALATDIGEAAIDTYLTILKHALQDVTQPTDEQKAAQLAYHTLYFFQVLTLDRGTTTGLLVHDQNDVGILGSLPPRIDKNLLASWRSRMPEPQDQLLDQLLAALPNQGICVVNDEAKQRLADALRAHYRSHPEALAMQATGGTTPPTIDNHR